MSDNLQSMTGAESDDRARTFVGLLAKHERSLREYVPSLIAHYNDAEDVLQSTKLKL